VNVNDVPSRLSPSVRHYGKNACGLRAFGRKSTRVVRRPQIAIQTGLHALAVSLLFRLGLRYPASAMSALPFDLAAAIAHLSAKDEKLAELISATIQFATDEAAAQSPYEALLEAIAYQSISGKAAATIFGRVKALGGTDRPPSPEQMLQLRKPALRKAGLSAAKILAMKDLASKTIDGTVPTREQALQMSDEELVERLVSVRGIGAWTVEMFLIFNLGRPDVLPVHDLGVKKGWSVTYCKKHMPTPKQLLAFGEQWRPYRTVASWYMWRAFERAGYAITNKIRAPKPGKRRDAKLTLESRRRKG
jgi:DNA-3-methyladenine glycosylase II